MTDIIYETFKEREIKNMRNKKILKINYYEK